MKASAHATVTSKGQVTIPREVRERLGIRAGDRLLFAVGSDGAVEVRKVASRSLDDLVGMLGRPRRRMTIEQMDEAIRERSSRRDGRG
ncbi:MAG: AbrB/MazE/SpoVT family DNA-binding domain-containing protein [Myxococcota bacterium]|nr:AbrB/MazE/SpoVT family DNA-binding domain-containing protein [Myxococcota bacterium]